MTVRFMQANDRTSSVLAMTAGRAGAVLLTLAAFALGAAGLCLIQIRRPGLRLAGVGAGTWPCRLLFALKFRNAEEALRVFDFARYGEELRGLKETLRQLAELSDAAN
jgi:hypothetical protein